MAQIELYFPRLLEFEGGYVNDKVDRGGATKYGVTLGTWKSVGYDKDGDGDIDAEDIRLLTHEDAMAVCKKFYWDRWKADSILNQSVAETLVEWVWGSGKWGIVIPQRVLQGMGQTSVIDDGIVGPATMAALNRVSPQLFHENVRIAKLNFIANLIKDDPSQKRFEKGWLRRINTFKFK